MLFRRMNLAHYGWGVESEKWREIELETVVSETIDYVRIWGFILRTTGKPLKAVQ